MEFNFFLWPMLVPMIIPLFYCFTYKKESLVEVGTITGSMILIVILYWPLLLHNFLTIYIYTYIFVKVLLFVIIPLVCLLIIHRKNALFTLKQVGIKLAGLQKSMRLCILFLPIMLGVTIIVFYVQTNDAYFDILFGITTFFESFTEEFLFRGILFIFLVKKTNIKIAYFTSLCSFVLMHPQHLISPFLISTIVQGVLTIEICRRSNNLLGAWFLHGTNRFFSLIIPFLLP